MSLEPSLGETSDAARLNELYRSLALLEQQYGLWDYARFTENGHELPEAGVYFFFEPGELREGHADWHRVVRVSTHRVGEGSQASLRDRLRNHFGAASSAIGRSSVFRDLVGSALFGRDGWLNHSDAVSQQRHQLVSDYMRSLWFVVAPLGDAAGKDSRRRTIEMGAIGLLSNLDRPPAEQIDRPSPRWLGLRAETTPVPHDHVRRSGLWNVDGVRQKPADTNPDFLALLATCAR